MNDRDLRLSDNPPRLPPEAILANESQRASLWPSVSVAQIQQAHANPRSATTIAEQWRELSTMLGLSKTSLNTLHEAQLNALHEAQCESRKFGVLAGISGPSSELISLRDVPARLGDAPPPSFLWRSLMYGAAVSGKLAAVARMRDGASASMLSFAFGGALATRDFAMVRELVAKPTAAASAQFPALAALAGLPSLATDLFLRTDPGWQDVALERTLERLVEQATPGSHEVWAHICNLIPGPALASWIEVHSRRAPSADAAKDLKAWALAPAFDAPRLTAAAARAREPTRTALLELANFRELDHAVARSEAQTLQMP